MTGRSIGGSDGLLLLLGGVVGLLNISGSDLLLDCVISCLLAGIIGSKSQELVLGNSTSPCGKARSILSRLASCPISL